MNNVVYKSFAYQFDPLVHVRLTNDKYDNIDMLVTNGKPYWMHFENPSKHLQQQLIKKLTIPKAVRTMLFAEELRPCCLKFEGSLFLAIPGSKSSRGAHEDVPFLRFWLSANGLVSVGMDNTRSIQDIQTDLKTVQDQGHFYCLSTIIQYIISYSEEIIYQLDEELDKIEADFAATDQTTTVSIMNIRQTIVRLRRYILPQRDALIFLSNKIGEISSDYVASSFKEIAETMLRQVDYLEVLRERAIITQDNLTNQIGEISNRRMYLLTIVMLIFTPASYIMGMFSMYLPIPGMNEPITWWIVNIVIVVITIALFVLFRIKRWL